MKAKGGVLATEVDVIGGNLSSETQSSILRHKADAQRRNSLKNDTNDARLRKEREAFEKRMRKASGQDKHLTTSAAEVEVVGGSVLAETQSGFLRHKADAEHQKSLKEDTNDARLRKGREAFEKRMRKKTQVREVAASAAAHSSI